MKAVILAGGLGTRISEESHLKPKPMVEIGGKPILWHIMKIYEKYGINDFIICLGYKGYLIKEFFQNYSLHTSDMTINLENNKVEIHKNKNESWNITLVDTGEKSMTGGRIKRIQEYVNDDTFCVTYGDGLTNMNMNNLISFHKEKKSVATLTAIHPPEKFGVLELSEDYVLNFHEKHGGEKSWINGGFFVFEPEIFDYLKDDFTILERGPLETLAQEHKLTAYKHDGFWQPMDTLREKNYLDDLWISGKAPWKVW
jgi:glucose-1-phosphate cytidylyltransferase